MDALRRTLRLVLFVAALLALPTGLALLASWVLPDLFHAFFPESFLHAIAIVQEERALVGGAHFVVGVVVIVLGAAALAERWMRGSKKAREVTSTTLFFKWLAGLRRWRAPERVRFREALRAPTVETLASIAVSIGSFALMLVPVDLLHALGLGIHRANALYALVIGGYWILYVALRERRREPKRVTEFKVVARPSPRPGGPR